LAVRATSDLNKENEGSKLLHSHSTTRKTSAVKGNYSYEQFAKHSTFEFHNNSMAETEAFQNLPA
jgi:hypothetical protein